MFCCDKTGTLTEGEIVLDRHGLVVDSQLAFTLGLDRATLISP